MRRLRILLVDDDVMISELLAELLVGIGHEVCGMATTETEAIMAAARIVPDLMIIDAQLQAGSGMSAMNTILQRVAMPHIFMTGGSKLSMPPKAMVLRKPFGKTSLIAALDSIAWQFPDRVPNLTSAICAKPIEAP